jgi:hypothetical protein
MLTYVRCRTDLGAPFAHTASIQGEKRMRNDTTSRDDVKRTLKPIVCMSAVLIGGCAGLSYQPTGEQAFGQAAAQGCAGNQGRFIVRGNISQAYEDSVILSDPADARSTMAVMLPGRGTLARLQGTVSTNKYQASQQRLTELGLSGIPVVATLECRGGDAPRARNFSYTNEDGSSGAITF